MVKKITQTFSEAIVYIQSMQEDLIMAESRINLRKWNFPVCSSSNKENKISI